MKNILRIVLPIGILFYCFYLILYPPSGSGYLFINMQNVKQLPKDFRIIPELKASGGAQFSEESLKKILETLPSKNVEIVDAREESHGFINGIAFSWYAENNCGNSGKSLQEIEVEEKSLLQDLLKQKTIALYTRSFVLYPVVVKTIETEKELTARYGLGYRRFPMTDHHKPKDMQVDAFVEMVKALPEDIWLHFHCLQGRGRTTTLLAMLDIMRNANRFTLEEIAKRQEDFGGLNILKPPSRTRWKYPFIMERIEFFKLFYQYCQEGMQGSWSEWINKYNTQSGS